jgi:tetratricopeptide (TPR) repeat protein
VEVATALQKDFPDVALYRDRLSSANNHLADAIADSKPVEAEAILRRNLILTERTEIFRDRAQTYLTLAVSLDKQQHVPEAEEACRQAIALFEKALAKSPSMRSLEVDLGESLRQLATILDEGGRPQEAEESCRRAIALFDRSAADFPSGPHIRWGQARVRFQHASVLLKLKRPAEAEAAYRRAVELSDLLANDFPTLPGYRMTAIDRSRVLAEFLRAVGRVDEAQQMTSKVARTFENLPEPPNPRDLVLRAHFYGGLGEWDKAATDLAKAIELGSEDVLGAWYPLAVLHLRAHRLNEYHSLCEKLLARFGKTDDRWVVIVCKLAPDAVTDLAKPTQIGRRLVDADPKSAESVGVCGDMLYRSGDLEAARRNLEASINTAPEIVGVQWRKLFLAMTYYRLGRAADAQRLFLDVTEWMETNLPGSGPGSMLGWSQQLDLELTHRETKELLGKPKG